MVMVSASNISLIVGCVQRRVGDAMPVGDGDLLPVARVRIIVWLVFQVCSEQVVRRDIDKKVSHA